MLFFRLNAVNAVNAAFFSGSLPLAPLSFRLNAVDATIFPVKPRLRRCFSGWTPLAPLFFQLNAVNAVNAAIFLVLRR